MKRRNVCPKCSGELRDRLVVGRKLQRCCVDCGWKGKKRIPGRRKIKTAKECWVGQFWGFHYEVYDQYGHPFVSSRYYDSREEAVKNLLNDLHSKQVNMSPRTAVLYPPTVQVNGEVFKEVE